MYAPATPAQPAPPAPVELLSMAPASIAAPVHTSLRVRGAKLNVLTGHSATVTGSLLEAPHHGLPRRIVLLQALRRHGWSTLARGRTSSTGRFHISFLPRSMGSQLVRLRFAGDGGALPARRRLGRLNVFRLAEASWYGGGGGLACGGSLSRSTPGAASRTLPCGTLVTLRYGRRPIRGPVVDRGP